MNYLLILFYLRSMSKPMEEEIEIYPFTEEEMTEIRNERDRLYLDTDKPLNYMIIPKSDWYNITRDENIQIIGDPESFKFPENPDVYNLRSFKTDIDDKGHLINVWYDVIEFKALKLGFIKNKDTVELTIHHTDINCKEFYTSTLFSVRSKVDDHYFYVLFKILYHVPNLLYSMFDKTISSYLKMDKNIKGQVDFNLIDMKSKYDIQITSIDFTTYTIRGIRNNIITGTFMSFYFRVIKSVDEKYYVFTNLYNEETILEKYGIKPMKLQEQRIPEFQELALETKGSRENKYLTKFDVAFEDILKKTIDRSPGLVFHKDIDIVMEIKFTITIPRTDNEYISKNLKKQYLSKKETPVFFTYMTYSLDVDLNMPNIDESSISIGTLYFI